VEQRDHLRTWLLEQARRRRELAEPRECHVDLDVGADVPHRADAERRILPDLHLHRASSRIAWNEPLWAPLVAEVHSVRRRELDAHSRAPPESRRRIGVARPKGARERLVRLVTRVERDRGDGRVGAQQPPRGALEPESPHQLERRLPHHSTEDAVEVERGQARLLGERLERERLVEVRDDVLDDALDGVRVV
jgi:hypothetical protein